MADPNNALNQVVKDAEAMVKAGTLPADILEDAKKDMQDLHQMEVTLEGVVQVPPVVSIESTHVNRA